MANEMTASDTVAARIRDVRAKRKLRVADLAERCAALGAPGLTAQALYKLEQRDPAKRRPRAVSVDELLVLALALNVAPVHLLVPVDGPGERYQVTAKAAASRFSVRAWIRGVGPIDPDADRREFDSEVPRDEYYYPAHLSGDGEAMIGPVQGRYARREDSDGEH